MERKVLMQLYLLFNAQTNTHTHTHESFSFSMFQRDKKALFKEKEGVTFAGRIFVMKKNSKQQHWVVFRVF